MPRAGRRALYDVHIDVSEEGRQLDFYYTGNGFLHNMVRSMTGTLIDIGRGRFPADAMEGIIAGKKRANAGKTLEGKGLTLVAVDYGAHARMKENKPLSDKRQLSHGGLI